MICLTQMETASLAKQMTDRQRISRLWRDYIWPQKTRLFFAVFFMALFAAATAGYIYLIQLIIDAATALDSGGGAVENAKRYAAIILPVILGLTLASGIGGYIHTGELIAKFTNDISVVSAGLVRVLGNLIKDLLSVIFAIAVMLHLNWQLSVFMAIFGLALLPIIAISKRMRGSAKEVQEHIGHMTAELKESLGAKAASTPVSKPASGFISNSSRNKLASTLSLKSLAAL